MDLANIHHLRDDSCYVLEFDDPDVELFIVHEYPLALWVDSETGNAIGDVEIGRA